MSIRFATIDEIAGWDKLVALNPNGGSVFQVRAFAEIKQSNFWTPRYIVVGSLYCLVLERTVRPLGKFWYMPKGPGISNMVDLVEILPELKKFAALNGVFTVRLEPEITDTRETRSALKDIGLIATKGIQAANTIIIDINRPLDEVVASFSGKTRYNIRQAEKENLDIKIVETTSENCKIFYELMKDTIAGRSYLRPFSYFKKYWQYYSNSDAGFFMFAYKKDILQAVDFIMINGTKAARKDAGSSRDHAIRGATALMEVEAIKILQSRGVKYYDLYGSPPAANIKDPTHPFYGFGTFKAGFNSTVTDYVGCQDLVIKSLVYKYWAKYGERLAQMKHRKIYGDRYY